MQIYCINEIIKNMYELLIKKTGISVTKKRIALLETLANLKKPVTIDELSQNISESMDTSTIYRSLRVLVESGLVYQTDFHEGVSYYEFQGNNHHHHITCTKCKNRESVDLCFKKDMAIVAEKKSFTITNHIFELFGICKKCL